MKPVTRRSVMAGSAAVVADKAFEDDWYAVKPKGVCDGSDLRRIAARAA